MFGVKYRQMLVGDYFQLVCADAVRQRSNLRGVEIVGWRNAGESHCQVGLRRHCVGRIQAEVADQWLVGFALQCLQQAARTHQNRTIQLEQKANHPLFAGFQNPRAGDAGGDATGLNPLHCWAQTVQFQIIQRNTGGPHEQRGFELFGCSHQQMQLRNRIAGRLALGCCWQRRSQHRQRIAHRERTWFALSRRQLFDGLAAQCVEQRAWRERTTVNLNVQLG